MKITMPPLHNGQNEVLHNQSRFKAISAGRRWGKSRLGAAMCIANAVQGKRAWWISPSFPMSQIGWREIKNLAKQIPGYQVRESDRSINFGGSGYAQVKSSDNPDSLRGEGLDFVVLDECAFMKEETWSEALRPALSDRKGSALFISTPKGRNFFWRIWQQGQENNGEWKSWKYPTTDNPFIDPGEVEAAKRTLAERIFNQEYMGEFIDDSSGLFRRIVEAATSQEISAAQNGRQYIAGVDVAALVDFTVVSVFDVEARSMVFMDRFNKVDYTVLEDRLHALYDRYHLTAMVIESNSIGQPVIDTLANRGLSVIPFTTTNVTKQSAIQLLQSAFEHGNIKILPDPILIGELQSFEGERLPSGSFKYSAPDGCHDDCVLSLAIAWQAIEGGNTWLIS